MLAVLRQVWDLTEAATYCGYLRPGVPERAEAEARRDDILDAARAVLHEVDGTNDADEDDPTGALMDQQMSRGY
jgi:hypothetical protein